ncbi:uncharacterized protein LOC136078872 [Hydra vulgaris]|uniref:Uncharacterized protein LOC136078872 n=1 Tax=Hydra vulgaris TaxID=6087 RepID=A0ABM4BNT0_HYDVU
MMLSFMFNLTDLSLKNKKNVLEDIVFEENAKVSLSNKYNKFQIKSIQDIEKSIKSESNYNVKQNIHIEDNVNAFNGFKQMNRNDFDNIVKNMKNKNSMCGNISVKMFKNIYPSKAVKLLEVVNLSLKTGIVPKSWKKSTIIPIPKTNSPKQLQDLRPINMLPV